MGTFKKVLRLCKPYTKNIGLGIMFLLFMNTTRLIMPRLTGKIIDDVIKGGDYDMLYKIVAIILVMVTIRALSHYMRNINFERASQGVVYDLRVGLYGHLQKMPFEFFDKNRIGEIMSRMTGDIEGIRNFVAGGINQICENFVWFFGSMIFLFMLEWRLTFVILAISPFVAWSAMRFSKYVRPAHKAMREQNAVLNTRAQENIAGMRVVKAFAREDYEKELFDKENMMTYQMQMRWVTLWAKYYPIMDVFASLCMPAALIFGGYMVVDGSMTLGDLVAFTGYIWMINSPMRSVGNIINMLTNTLTSAEKLFYYRELGPSIRNRPGCISSEDIKGEVEFKNVTFSYGDEKVLHDISFKAEEGETIAIMGLTGSGKTSVVNLMARFYETNVGEVLIDGVDVRNYDLHSLRNNIGYVAQETFLFSETIANNIAFGRPGASMEAIEKAARIAQAHEFITHMPDGYETVVGERGMGLSGGQKQRVAIARALLYNPRILVMDDSTSAVDMETEFDIQNQLRSEMGKRTTFIIAHRISSVKDADMILVLENGRIAERGSHDELIEQQGIYYGMFNDQYSDYDRARAGVMNG
ncbi:MAG: ABC transporter ATP-binding protein [Christensenellales bacterium]|jgi:ATP-binding cassette subfamily B multidrug efflux pump